jgi:CDP-diacylglycerol--glycerol-3-phosphate 3-phosphatidyltransferase
MLGALSAGNDGGMTHRMPTIYALKPRFQGLLRPLVQRWYKAGVTANQVTLAALAGSVLVGVGIAAAGTPWLYLLLPVWLAARMALNAVDGMLAREFGQKSRLGAYLNELADVASDAVLFLPFAVVPAFDPLAVAVVAVLAILSEYAGVMGPMVGASRRYDGPMGKSDRAAVLAILGAWVGFGLPMPGWTGLILWAVAGLLAVTIVNRVRSGLAEGRPTG